MWHGILGHDQNVARLKAALERRRLASTFLFVGPRGIGKHTFALKFAQALLCSQNSESMLDPCEQCPTCQQVAAKSHPDLFLVSKPPEKSFLPLELFVGEREHRLEEGLCHSISLRPFFGGRKVAIIDDADYLNQEGANALLKTLEEPPPFSVIILVGTSEQKQLSTIRSRCQIVRFDPLTPVDVANLLLAKGLATDPDQAARLAEMAEGSVARASELSDPALWEFREHLLPALAQSDGDSTALAKSITSFVEQAGKESPVRRARLRQLSGFAAAFYRQLMRSLEHLPLEGDSVLRTAVLAARTSWRGNSETAAACLQRSLETMSHIDANANLTLVVDEWIDDLAAMTRTGICLVH